MLRRYPVKSMLGETLATASVTGSGLEGDRALALIHPETGKVVSAKNPRLWRDMLTFTAAGYPEVMIGFPDGTIVPAKPSSELDTMLSDALGHQVTLAAVPPPGANLDRSRPDEVLSGGINAVTTMDVVTLPGITFHDFAAVHLVTTSTLRVVGTELERYRPNIVLEADDEGFSENAWLGRRLRIGQDVILRVVARTPRCAVPTLRHGTMERDTDALRIPAKLNRVAPVDGAPAEPCVGAYAQVIRPGTITVGDLAELRGEDLAA